MHELSIALSLLDIASEEAARHEGRIAAIHLRLGPLSGVIRDALVSAFELAREGTPASQAELIVEETPLVVSCPSCNAEHTLPTPLDLRCPGCGAATTRVVGGRELEVVALELAT